ncbi:MAG: hypothetical protein MMC23_007509 [Stictis urceolatum]|nr:hypothetical protein [Stictis urceolata]
MQTVTGCKINVSQPSGPDFEREIGLIGTRSSIEYAKRAIMEKVHAVEEKNRSGGGRQQQPREQYNQYPQQQQYPAQGVAPASGYNQGPAQYGQQQGGLQAQASGEDPYSAYGGYQAYAAMWYAAMQQQNGGQGQMPQGQPGSGRPPA